MPLSNFIPGLGVLVIAFGLLGKDGLVTIIGIFIGFVIITLEKSLSYLNDYSFIAAILLKAIIYSISILVFLLLFAVAFNKIAAHISYEQALSRYVDDRLFERLDAAAVGRPTLLGNRTSLTLAEGMVGIPENSFLNVKNFPLFFVLIPM